MNSRPNRKQTSTLSDSEVDFHTSAEEHASNVNKSSHALTESYHPMEDAYVPQDDPIVTTQTNPNHTQSGRSDISRGGILGLKTCLHSSTRWFQLIMFAAFLIALTLGMTQEYENLSPGVIWGAVLSTFSVFFVILSYISVPSYRQHPNPLVFWRTIADAIFVLQLLTQQFVRCLFYDCVPLCRDRNWQCGCADKNAASETCKVFAGFFQFSLIAAECWFLCMTINLLVSLNNPFTHFERNTKYYHYFCWGMGLVMGLLLMNTSDWAGYSHLGVCWTNSLRRLPAIDSDTCPINANIAHDFVNKYRSVNANFISWMFFYVWIAFIIIFAIAVWIWASRRLSEGMPQTYAVRVQSIDRTRFNVFAVNFYWIIVAVVYFNSLTTQHKAVRELLNFIIAGKGYLDLVVWFALNDFCLSHFYHYLKDNLGEANVDLSPQVNAALRQEVLFYTTSGIIQAVKAAERLPLTSKIQHLALLPQNDASTDCVRESPAEHGLQSLCISNRTQRSKTFHDYEPHAFSTIRKCFQVTDEAYVQSVSATAKERLSEGASGAFMFFSADGSLIVKSMSREECQFLRNIASSYASYLCHHPESLLTRFYGCHCLELYGKQFSFVVMANLFDTDQTIHSRYDIKGSWVNRHADLPKKGKSITCRHCNRKYTYSGHANADTSCPVRLCGHEPNVVLKDSDLTQKLKLEKDVAQQLYRQLRADTKLLCSFGIMDYSLLIGVHEVEYVVDDEDQLVQERREDTSQSRTATPYASHPAVDDRRNTRVNRRSLTLSSERHLPRDGMRLANTVVGPAYYHLGIIDILQTWTLQKKMERCFKIIVKRVDGNGLSAIPPELYRERFQAKMADILDVSLSSEEEAERLELFTQQNLYMDVDTQPMQVQSVRSLHPAALDSYAIHGQASFSKGNDDRYVAHGETEGLDSGDGMYGQLRSHRNVGRESEEYSGIDYHL